MSIEITFTKNLVSEEPDLISGQVRPVLLVASDFGEVLVVAVVGHTNANEPFARVATPRVLRCLPPDLGHACQSFGAIVAADFVAWCASAKAADVWNPPIGGLQLGEWVNVEAYDINSIAQRALEMCALNSNEVSKSNEDAIIPVTPRTSDEARFLELVKAEVTRRRPTLKGGFKKSFSLTGKEAGGEIDFVGSRYATCYSAINPKGRASLRLQTASAGLWRLARARDAFGFAAPEVFELTAWIPPEGQPIFTDREYQTVRETVAELEEEAKREQLRVFTATGPGSACERLFDVEKLSRPS